MNNICPFCGKSIFFHTSFLQPDNIPDIPNRPWDDEEPDEDKR